MELKNRISDCETPALLALAGPTCSGKTSLAQKMQDEAIPHLGATVVPMDCYYKNLGDADIPLDENGWADFDRPESYRTDCLRKTVENLLNGHSSWLPQYDLAENTIISEHGTLLEAMPWIVAEGLFAINALDGVWPRIIKVFMMIDEDTALERRIKRDTELYQMPADLVRNVFYRTVWPRQLAYVLPQAQKADLVIRGGEG